MDHGLRDDLPGKVGEGERRVALVGGPHAQAGIVDDAPGRRREGRMVLGAEHRPVDDGEGMLAGLAEPLHGQQRPFEAGRLVRIGPADVRPAQAVHDGGPPGRPLPGERLDHPRRDAGLLGRPRRRLGHPVFFAQHVVPELLEAHAVGRKVVLVVGVVGDPLVRDRELQRGIGVRQDRDPLVGEDGRAVVEVRADVDLLDADVLPEGAEAADVVPAAEPPGGGRGVAPPEQQEVTVPGDVRIDVGGVRHQSERLAAPEVLGPPVPALPAVRVAHLQRAAAQELQELDLAAVRPVHHLGLAVSVGLGEHGRRSVGVDDPLQLTDDDVQRLVPGDPDVAALAAVLRVALSVGVPVDPLQRIRDPVRRVDALLVAQAERIDGRLERDLEGLAAGLDLPGAELLRPVLPVIGQRTDADDPVALHVHCRYVRADAERGVPRRLDARPVWAAVHRLVRHAHPRASSDATRATHQSSYTKLRQAIARPAWSQCRGDSRCEQGDGGATVDQWWRRHLAGGRRSLVRVLPQRHMPAVGFTTYRTSYTNLQHGAGEVNSVNRSRASRRQRARGGAEKVA